MLWKDACRIELIVQGLVSRNKNREMGWRGVGAECHSQNFACSLILGWELLHLAALTGNPQLGFYSRMLWTELIVF